MEMWLHYFVDNSLVTDHSWNQYRCTVRRVDCDMLCERSSRYPLHCKSCQAFRSTLRSMVSRQSNESDSHTSASSHTRYCDLTPGEKDKRMKNFIMLLRFLTRK